MASLISKASLLMVPSVYEDGTLYNVLPSGNKAPDETGSHNGYDQTRADFTFSRGSNLAATRVNASGLIEKGRENLLLQSNQFDTTWAGSNASVTSGQSGYDGTNDAWLLSKSASNGRVQQSYSFNGSVLTLSVYAKANTDNWLALFQGGKQTFFDLQNGVKGFSDSGVIASSIESAGNGFYRCSVTFNYNGSSTIRIYPADSDGDTTGTSGSIYIQDAQLEKGLVPTDYIETGSSTAQAGILEDMPRINYDANGENGALLLEPSRSNLVPESEWFGTYGSNANGTGFLPLIYTNDAISPDGYKNATKIIFDAGSGTTTGDESQISKNIGGLTTGADYTLSFYAKGENGGEEIVSRAVSGGYTKFTLTTEWKRYELTQSAASTSYAIWFGVRQGLGGIGTINSNATIYLWGVQEEAASHVSSYIPTHGAAVTRGAELISSTNDLLSGADDMAWFVEYTLGKESTSSFRNQFGYRDNADANFYMVQFPNSNTHEFRYRGVAAQNIDMTPSIDEATYGLHRKIVYLKRGTTLKVFCNGSEIATTTNAGATTFSTTNENFEVGSNYPPEMDIRQFSVFNGSISDAEAIALTTL
jgi:hypothetical protein